MAQEHTGGQAVVRALRDLGSRIVFAVSGNQILPIFDAASDNGVRLVHMRHESAAAFAAAGMTELSGQPGVLLTSAGPAFLAAFTGIATVRAMELPILFLSGDSAIKNAGFGNFQELNQQAACREICKASFKATSVESIPGILAEAWRLSQSGIPGPVHVGFPGDVLLATSTKEAPIIRTSEQPDPPPGALNEIAGHLQAAERPMLIGRPFAARGRAGELLNRLAAQLGVQPVIMGAPRGLADSKYSHLASLYKRSDCALVIGPSDYSLGYLDESIVAASGKLLVVDAPGDPKIRRQPTVRLQFPVIDTLEYLVAATAKHVVRDAEWSRSWTQPLSPEPRPTSNSPEAVHPLEVAAEIRSILQPDDILVVDGGEFCQWIRQGLRDVPNRWIWNSKFGIIGNSIPISFGIATFGHQGRIIAIMGDGGSAYHLAEFESAARYGAAFVAIIGNDSRWGAEWHIQANRYGPDRTFETSLLPARYDLAAIGFGAEGFHVTDAVGLRSALDSAFASGKPTCINVTTESVRSSAVAP